MRQQALGQGRNRGTTRFRGYQGMLIQGVLCACMLALGWYVTDATLSNLAARGITTGFGFMFRPAGFDLAFTLVPFTAASPIWMALVTGIANTVFLAATGVVLGTLLGLAVVALRLSSSPVASTLAAGYIGVFRNTPILLHLSFWYFAVFARLPPVNRSIGLGDWGYLNSRGLYLPSPSFGTWTVVLGAACLLLPSVGAALVRRRAPTSPLGRIDLGVVAGVSLLALVVATGATGWSYPVRAGLGLRGGFALIPELMAAVVAIAVYSSAFIAELLRGAIQSVDRGQTEAGQALGLPRRVVMRRIVLPQALRLVMPPLTNQYVNTVKQTAIVASIGFPDLMLVFGKSVLTQTGQAIEVLTTVAASYLTVSLLCAGAIHLYALKLRSQGLRR